MTGPLERFRVLECGSSIPVRFAGLLLAEMGADVMVVDALEVGGTEESPHDRVLLRRKQRVNLADILEHLPALAQGVDVIVGDVAQTAPIPSRAHQIRCRVPVFPSELSFDVAGNDPLLVDAYAGLLATVRTWRGGPGFLEQPEGVFGAGVLAALACCSALLVRESTGVGQDVEVSWLAGALGMQMFNIAGVAGAEAVFKWEDSDPRGWLPTFRLYQGSDGKWFYVACLNPTFWARLCLAIGREDLAIDPRFEDSPYVAEESDRRAVKEILEKAFSSRPADEWIEALEQYEVIAGPVLSRDEWLDHPQTIAERMRIEVDDPILGRTLQAGGFLQFSGMQPGRVAAQLPGSADINSLLDRWSPRAEATHTEAPMSAPLEGIRVLELASYAAGPIAGKLLADLGASVTKIEPLSGDPFRQIGFGFAVTNGGKRSIAINVRERDGLKIVRKIIADSDILFTNWRPDALDRANLSDVDVHEMNDAIVYAGVTGFGWSGPWRDKPCVDLAVQAVTGWASAQGGASTPTAPGPWPFDNFVPQLLALSTVAGLLAVRGGERRVAIKTSMAACAMAMQVDKYFRYDDKVSASDLTPDAFGWDAGYRIYQAADGWILVAATTQREWTELANEFQVLDERNDPRVSDSIAEQLARGSMADAMERLGSIGVACGPIKTRQEVMMEPLLRDAGLIVVRNNPEWGPIIQTGRLLRFSSTPQHLPGIAPKLGEHASSILNELGYGEKELLEFDRRGDVVRKLS